MMTEMTKDPLTEPAGGANPASAGGEDDLGAYFRELRQYPRLSPQEERELAVACAAGDPAAMFLSYRRMMFSEISHRAWAASRSNRPLRAKIGRAHV